MNRQIVEFYTGNGEDACGRTFDEILTFSFEQMEEVHDYIQWLFPTLTPSLAQKQSPVLDESTIKLLKNSIVFLNRYQAALKKTFEFWGLAYTHRQGARDIDVLPIQSWHAWMNKADHNQLRMARVLESARLLGFENTSRSLFHVLLRSSGTGQNELTCKNAAYWFQAAYGIQVF